MGFPPIPGSRSPVLVCARAEVNAAFTNWLYFDDQRVYIVSSLARGGFSGGPALTPPHHRLGVITRAMVRDEYPEELGFMAVVPPTPILELLDHKEYYAKLSPDRSWEPYRRMKNGAHRRRTSFECAQVKLQPVATARRARPFGVSMDNGCVSG